MAFMYLKLEYKTSEEAGDMIFGEGLWATISTNGDLRSLGGENSRMSNNPVGVFQLSGFDGLENISDDDLVKELLRRMGPEKLMERMGWQLDAEQLMIMLAARTGVKIQRTPPPRKSDSW
jgi:hypothetical protein